MTPLERSDLQILFPVVALKHVVAQTRSDIEPQRPASTHKRVRNQVLSCLKSMKDLETTYGMSTKAQLEDEVAAYHCNWCLPTQMLLLSVRKSFPMVPKFFWLHLQSRVASGERTESLLRFRTAHRLVIIYNIPYGGGKHYSLHLCQRGKRTIKSVFSSSERR